jgi:hypothetical protein
MKKFAFLVLLFGCSYKDPLKETNHRYVVVSSFNEVVLETDEKAEAYEYAYNLTSMGRMFVSKPIYFVLEKK